MKALVRRCSALLQRSEVVPLKYDLLAATILDSGAEPYGGRQ